jgi:hypothetical protein
MNQASEKKLGRRRQAKRMRTDLDAAIEADKYVVGLDVAMNDGLRAGVEIPTRSSVNG